VNTTKLEKAYKLLDAIRAIDQDIKKLQGVAELIAKGAAPVRLKLSWEKKVRQEQSITDILNHGQSLHEIMFSRMGGNPYARLRENPHVPKEDSKTLRVELNETVTYEIIGILIAEKNKVREGFEVKLKALGIK
jgi:hypothetical protein